MGTFSMLQMDLLQVHVVSEPMLLQPSVQGTVQVWLQAGRLIDGGVRLFMAGAPSGI